MSSTRNPDVITVLQAPGAKPRHERPAGFVITVLVQGPGSRREVHHFRDEAELAVLRSCTGNLQIIAHGSRHDPDLVDRLRRFEQGEPLPIARAQCKL